MKAKILLLFIPILLVLCITVNSEDYIPINDASDNFVYKIGADDVLQIGIWGYDDLTKKVTVRRDGMITYEMLGDVHVAGLTPTQLSVKLSQKLSQFLRDPKVIVKVVEIKSQKVTVLGDVSSPGTKYLTGKTKLLDLLTSVGWQANINKAREVTIMRKGGQVIKINLDDIIVKGDPSQNIYLKNRDTIILPKPVIGSVIIDGEVGTPGEYEIPKGKKMLVSDLLRMSGGLKNSADMKRTKIVRKNGQTKIVNLEGLKYINDQSENYMLNDGDRMYIPRVRETRIYIYGSAQSKGIVKLTDPNPHLAKLISVARAEYFAVLSDIKVIRDNPNSPGHPIVFNIDLKKLLYRQDNSQNISLENNDVIFIPQSFIGSFAEFLDNVWPTITHGATVVEDFQDIKKGDYANDNNNNRR